MMIDLPKHNIAENIDHETRGNTVVEIADLDCGGDEETDLSLIKVIEQLTAALMSVPEEHRPSAVLRVRAYGDDSLSSFSITAAFLRPETDEELADRQRWLKSIDDEDEERERKTYARLREKYEK